MKLPKLILAVIISISSLVCKSQQLTPRIEIVQPTIEQEASSVWRTINDIAFLEKQGYHINLPHHPLIDSLVVKSKNGAFGNDDFPTIYTVLANDIFDPKNYEQAIQEVKKQADHINYIIHQIDSAKTEWDWDFKSFDAYRVIFTLYGTGGSYDPDEGHITLLTNKEGGFMNYKNPANTIIHEITHIGMEYSIVQKYSLSHSLKERIVDAFVYLMFQKGLPEYKIQTMGDEKIDRFLNKKEDIGSLSVIVSAFVNK